MTYRSYIIEHKPTPASLLDWWFHHEDYDGRNECFYSRFGRADSCGDAMSQIDAIIEEGE